MSRLPALALAGLVLALFLSDGEASSTKLVAHVVPAASSNACATGALTHCSQAVVRGSLATPGAGPFYNVYILAARGSLRSIAGVQFGIDYEANRPQDLNDHVGIDILQWHYCADVQYPTPRIPRSGTNAWPEPHSGNLLTWNLDTHCQTGETTVIGYFYMAAYSPDVLRIVPRPADQLAAIIDCQIEEQVNFIAADLGFASFSPGGNSGGCNPCTNDCVAITAVQSTSWSQIKAEIARSH